MKKLFPFMAVHKKGALTALSLVLFQSLAELILPNLMAVIVDKGVISNDISLILRLGILMLFVSLAGVVFAISGTFFASKTAMAFGRDVRSNVFSRIMSWSPRDFESLGTATLITRTTNDVTQVQGFALMSLRMLARAPLMMLGSLILAFSMDRHLSLILIFVIPFLIAAVIFMATRGMPLFKAMQEKLDGLNLVLREGLTGIRVIRAFDRDDVEKVRFAEANDQVTDISLKAQRFMGLMMPIMMIIMNLSAVAIVWFGGIRVERGQLQVGQLMAFLQYAAHILFSLMMLSMMFVMYPRASISASRLNEILDMQTSIRDPQNPLDPEKSVRGKLEFRNVSFRYPGAEAYALKDISFSCAPGEVTAIIGGTGSGKSTLLSLLMRFFDTASGTVLLDDIDVQALSQDNLRSKIGYVPQKATLFSGTIAENLRFGKEDATDNEIHIAIATAQAEEFISELKEGIHTLIAQDGTNLSGGQKQRLGIARALLRRPEIYAFDDSFSALDFKTDLDLRTALSAETKEASVLIVAQRVGTVMNADRIIVLDEGHIVGMGRHEELVRTCSIYREIVHSQLSSEAVAGLSS